MSARKKGGRTTSSRGDVIDRLASGLGGYERAIVEATWEQGRRTLRVRALDGAAILNEGGRPLPCWNALSEDQRNGLIDRGGRVREPEGDDSDHPPATVLIEAPLDEAAPGPRFYCYDCAALRAAELADKH